jgi:hypothetical protein
MKKSMFLAQFFNFNCKSREKHPACAPFRFTPKKMLTVWLATPLKG